MEQTQNEIRPRFLKAGEAAEILGVSKRTLLRWCAHHSVPFYRLTRGGALSFDEAELIAWYRERARVRVEQ